MTITVYVPCDTTARSLGADKVAQRIERAAAARSQELRVVRNGSRGLFWLEPLVEIDTPDGRVAYGPVTPEAVESLIEAGLFEGRHDHALALGLTEEIEYLKRQQRLTFSR
ncbi:MAG TPA: formate dehydrogenase, partial [Pseudomonas sp.]|nr:formate dehydrogenase [Pseudomonas sp.]